MMYPRLFLARQLLTDDGIIFVSIDDREVYNLRLMVNEIFGEENCLQQVVWQRHGGGGNDSKYFATDHEYILAYAKNLHAIDKLRRPLTEKEETEFKLKDDFYETRGPYKTSVFEPMRPDNPAHGLRYEIECPDGTMVYNEWGQKESGFLKLKDEDRIVFKRKQNGEWQVEKKIYLNESKRVPRSLLTKEEKNSKGRKQLREIFDDIDGVFSNPKPVGLIKHLLQFSTNSDSIVLDFFAGSCTTAQAVIELNQEDERNTDNLSWYSSPNPHLKNLQDAKQDLRLSLILAKNGFGASVRISPNRPDFAFLNSHHQIMRQKVILKLMTRRLFSVS